MQFKTGRTDLDMYYEKISLVYGQSSGRAISPDYPSTALDIQPKIDEYRIVGPTGASVGITSIKAGDGVTATTTITVTLASAMSGLDVDTAFRVNGITALDMMDSLLYQVDLVILRLHIQYRIHLQMHFHLVLEQLFLLQLIQ